MNILPLHDFHVALELQTVTSDLWCLRTSCATLQSAAQWKERRPSFTLSSCHLFFAILRFQIFTVLSLWEEKESDKKCERTENRNKSRMNLETGWQELLRSWCVEDIKTGELPQKKKNAKPYSGTFTLEERFNPDCVGSYITHIYCVLDREEASKVCTISYSSILLHEECMAI